MNILTLPTTLAFILSDVVFYGMIAVFVVGPWIAKTLKKISESQTPSSRSLGDRTFADSTPHKPNANELAAMRREKLQELARKRRSTIANPAAPASQTEPTNLTMAQRVERARAKAQYKKRAQALQQQRQASQQPQSAQTTAPQRAQQLKLARKQALAQQRAQALQRQQQPTAAKPPPSSKPRLAESKPRFTSLQAEHDQDTVHRHVPDAPVPAKKKETHHLQRFGASSLRQAIVLKEILDRPIALRDSTAGI